MAKKIVIAIIIGYTSIKLISYIKTKVIAYKMHRRAQRKKAERDAKVIAIPEVEESKQNYILSLHAYELADAIKAGKVTSVEATATYIRRAFILGRQFNLTTEEPFAEALILAQKCDLQLKESPESCGVLHGVPISLKDVVAQAGYACSAGLVYKLDTIHTEDALIVKILKDEGAIPFIRSNVPQALMWMESYNDIYGRAENPWSRNCTAGGSSGGESGLLACRASPLGIGSDIGGSIRIPAAFCGIYGFKTTGDRISSKGVIPAHPSGVNPFNFMVRSAIGPMGRCVEDLRIVINAWCQEKSHKKDFNVCPLPFNNALYSSTCERRNLRIGYFYDLDNFECCPSVRRGVRECKEALEKLGHTLVEFKFPDSKRALNIYLRNVSSCGNNVINDLLQGENPAYFYKMPIFLNAHPWMRKIILLLLRVTKNKRLHEVLNISHNISPSEYITLFRELKAYISEFTVYWNSLELDAVISPAYGTVATPHKEAYKVISSLIYSTVWNILGYPAGVVPVGTVKESETEYISIHNDIITSGAKKITKNSAGLPIAVHIASLPYQDEVALGLMKQIEEIFHFHKFPY